MFTDPSNFLRDLVNKLVPPPDFLTSPQEKQFSPNQVSPKRPRTHRPATLKTEAWYRDRLARELNGEIEVSTPVGRIDVLSSREIIEVKVAHQWKHALGQVLAYGHYYPYHQKRIHLYGEHSPADIAQARQQCQRHEVKVTWEP